MKTIYYFSGTGNSYHVAKELSEGCHYDLKPLLSEIGSTLKGSIGIVFPIYMNGLPKPVESFIKHSDFSDVDYLFAVSTHGGLPGRPEHYINHLLKEQDKVLDEYFDIKMIYNSPKGVAPKLLMRLNWEEDITQDHVEKMVDQSEQSILKIIPSIQNQSQTFKIDVEEKRRKASLFNKFIWKIDNSPKLEFFVNDSCDGCGLCEKICLSDRIQVTDHPEWVHDDCIYCYACFNYCPKQAIYVKHYEKQAGRYHYPDVSAKQIIEQKNQSGV